MMSKTFLTLILVSSLVSSSMTGLGSVGPNIASQPNKKIGKLNKRKCLTCEAQPQDKAQVDSIDALATLGRRTQPTTFMPILRSIFDGTIANLVSSASGHLTFAVTDLSVSGVIPISFQRVYASDRKIDSGLGIGWSFAFDDRITVNGNRATMSTGTGRVLIFRQDENSGRFSLAVDEPNQHQSFTVNDADTITEKLGGITRFYRLIGETYRLSELNDRNGNRITISFDNRGNIKRIANDTGGFIFLDWSNHSNARLLAVTDHIGQRVSFKRTGARLMAATDTSGAQLSYGYEGDQLTRAFDPVGRLSLLVRYDSTGRVREAGDALGVSAYQYDLNPEGVSRRTVMTNPIGIATIYEHENNGLLTAVSEPEGDHLRISYNSANRPLVISNSMGDETKFTYDAQNRLMGHVSSLGGEVKYTRDEQGQVSSLTTGNNHTSYVRDDRGNVVAVQNGEAARNYSLSLNPRGQVVSTRSESGRVLTSEYDSNGNETAFTFSDIGRFETARDSSGRIKSKAFPSGLRQDYRYDSRGRLLSLSNSRGHFLTLERDKGGSLARVTAASGEWISASRDEAGRIVKLTNRSGKSRKFIYDARGALTEYVNALGKHKRVSYDQRGRVYGFVDGGGNKILVERDKRGSVLRLSLSGIGGQRQVHDTTGRIIRSIGKSSAMRNRALFTNIDFRHSGELLPVPSSVVESDSEGFFDNDGFYESLLDSLRQYWSSEDWSFLIDSVDLDPFGPLGFGGCGGFESFTWFIDPWSISGCGTFGGETYAQCVARHNQICENNRTSCGATAVGALAVGSVACAALAGNPPVFAICIAALFAKYLADLSACDLTDQNCRLMIPDKCVRSA